MHARQALSHSATTPAQFYCSYGKQEPQEWTQKEFNELMVTRTQNEFILILEIFGYLA